MQPRSWEDPCCHQKELPWASRHCHPWEDMRRDPCQIVGLETKPETMTLRLGICTHTRPASTFAARVETRGTPCIPRSLFGSLQGHSGFLRESLLSLLCSGIVPAVHPPSSEPARKTHSTVPEDPLVVAQCP